MDGRTWGARHAPAVAGLAAAALIETVVRAAGTGPVALAVLLLVALATTAPAALPGQPMVAGAVVTGSVLLSLAAFQTLTFAGVAAQLACGYRLGRHKWRPAVLLAAPFPVLLLFPPYSVAEALLGALAPAAALAGAARRARADADAGTAERQEIAGTLMEHTARGERARIARELHDVVAHHISMVAVQAESARLAVPGMPADGAARLSAIGDTARAALTEMRRLLGVLREDAEPARRPQPGLTLEELIELIDESRDASASAIRLLLTGTPVPLSPGAGLAAYRIVQEALTNARRHAPGAAVDVEVHFGDDGVRLLVRDNGGAAAAGRAAGFGLAGMRERATAAGGELRAGPATGGGFLVEARLPGGDYNGEGGPDGHGSQSGRSSHGVEGGLGIEGGRNGYGGVGGRSGDNGQGGRSCHKSEDGPDGHDSQGGPRSHADESGPSGPDGAGGRSGQGGGGGRGGLGGRREAAA